MIIYFLFLIAAAYAGVAAFIESITRGYRETERRAVPRLECLRDERLDIKPALRRSR